MTEKKISYVLAKYHCLHCQTLVEVNKVILTPFLPEKVICLTCGMILRANRTILADADGKPEIWVVYK